MTKRRRILRPIYIGKIPIKVIKAAIKAVVNGRITVRYLGLPKVTLEDTLAKALVKEGYEFYASGYNFKTNIRDVIFEKIRTYSNCQS